MKISNKIKEFCFIKLRVWKYKFLSDCKLVKGNPRCYNPLLISGKGKITFGKNVQIGIISSPNFYSHYSYLEARMESSEILIGNNVAINNGFSAVAFSKIIIGDRVLIGLNCNIMDNDGHDLNPNKRNSDEILSEDVTIQENVFISDNVTILKGVTIGKNSVIGTGSVVTHSIPENVVAAGVPAKVINNLH
jgi:maltose O-acetyltransferase